METHQILIALAVVAAILFLVSVIMSHKSWRWHTILMVLLVLAAAGTFYGMSMQLLRIQNAWRTTANRLALELSDYQGRVAELEKGVFEEGQQVYPSVRQLHNEVRRTLLDRGRNWSGARPQGAAGGDGTVRLRIDRPFPAVLSGDMIVYAFDTTGNAVASLDERADGAYLGAFRITGVQENAEGGAAEQPAPAEPPAEGEEEAGEEAGEAAQPAPAPTPGTGHTIVTMVPAWRPSGMELGRVASAAQKQNATWSLYEKMPVDSYEAYADLDEAALRRFLPDATLTEYLRDREPADDDDPAERVFVKVKFLQDYTLPEVQLPGAVPDEEPRRMRAGETSWLRRESVEGPGGRQVKGALELAEDGVLAIEEDVEPRYERRLRDYAALFQDHYLARKRLEDDIADVTARLGDLRIKLREAQESITKFEDIKRRLEFDRQGFQRELTAVNRHLEALNNQHNELLAELRATFSRNQQMAAMIQRIQLEAAAEIDRRTAEAGSLETAAP